MRSFDLIGWPELSQIGQAGIGCTLQQEQSRSSGTGEVVLATTIPGVDGVKWYRKKWFVEFVAAFPPVLAAIAAAWKFFQDSSTLHLGWISVAGLAWLLVASGLKVIMASNQDKKDEPKEKHDGLRAALHVVHSTVAHACGFKPQEAEKKLRTTFHVVLNPYDAPKELQQVVDYVGGDGKGVGRKFSIRSGIIGKAARNRDAYAASRSGDNKEQYERELQDEWGYTAADIATNIAKERFSWMAVPVTDKSGTHTLGVVYLDSTERDTFSGDSAKTVVVMACAGIARYVEERYPKS
jgi:hypothetical protein